MYQQSLYKILDNHIKPKILNKNNRGVLNLVVFNTDANYYHALDRFDQSDDFEFGAPIFEGDQPKKDEWHSSLGPKELGTTSNPMQDQVKALVAKIREGASKVELEYVGVKYLYREEFVYTEERRKEREKLLDK